VRRRRGGRGREEVPRKLERVRAAACTCFDEARAASATTAAAVLLERGERVEDSRWRRTISRYSLSAKDGGGRLRLAAPAAPTAELVPLVGEPSSSRAAEDDEGGAVSSSAAGRPASCEGRSDALAPAGGLLLMHRCTGSTSARADGGGDRASRREREPVRQAASRDSRLKDTCRTDCELDTVQCSLQASYNQGEKNRLTRTRRARSSSS